MILLNGLKKRKENSFKGLELMSVNNKMYLNDQIIKVSVVCKESGNSIMAVAEKYNLYIGNKGVKVKPSVFKTGSLCGSKAH